MPDDQPRGPSALRSAALAYRFLCRRFPALLRYGAPPAVAAGLISYLSLSAYLAQLVQFIASGDPRSASLALAALAAGIFISMFCLAAGVSAVTRLALGAPVPRHWTGFTVARQEWRIYAAFLRYLLLVTGLISGDYLLAIFIFPLFITSGAVVTSAALIIAFGGILTLWAGVGFLIPAVVAQSTGSVLRKAAEAGVRDIRRNMALVFLLSPPALAIEIAGQYLLRRGAGSARVVADLPLASLARALEHRLPEFVLLSTAAGFVTVVLFTAAAAYCYRDETFVKAGSAVASASLPKLDSAAV